MKRIANNITIAVLGTLFGTGVSYMPWELTTWISAGGLLIAILACNITNKEKKTE